MTIRILLAVSMISALGASSTSYAEREGHGGNTLEINLTEARQLAKRIVQTVSVGRLNAIGLDNEAEALYDNIKDRLPQQIENLRIEIISPTNGDEPLYADRVGILRRVEALYLPNLKVLRVDRDLVNDYDKLRLAKLLIHEAGHALGYDDSYEDLLNEVVIAVFRASDVDPIEEIRAQFSNESSYEILKRLFDGATDPISINDIPEAGPTANEQMQCVYFQSNRDYPVQSYVRRFSKKVDAAGPVLPERTVWKVSLVYTWGDLPLTEMTNDYLVRWLWESSRTSATQEGLVSQVFGNRNFVSRSVFRRNGNLIAFHEQGFQGGNVLAYEFYGYCYSK